MSQHPEGCTVYCCVSIHEVLEGIVRFARVGRTSMVNQLTRERPCFWIPEDYRKMITAVKVKGEFSHDFKETMKHNAL